MTERTIRFVGIHPSHPRRPEPSRVELNVQLSYLRGGPVLSAVLSERDLVRIIEQAALGLRVLATQREEGSK